MKRRLISIILFFALVVTGYAIYFYQAVVPEQKIIKQFKQITRISNATDKLYYRADKDESQEIVYKFLDYIAELESLEVPQELKVIKTNTIIGLRSRARELSLLGDDELSSAQFSRLSFEVGEAFSKANFDARVFMYKHGLSKTREFGTWFNEDI